MIRIALTALALLLAHGSSMAEDAAAPAAHSGVFIGDGTYSPEDGCARLAAIKAGKAEPNIASYPMSLTANGTKSWEGGCSFVSIRDVDDKVHEATMKCSEGSDEYDAAITFTRIDDNKIEVASEGDKLVYVRCKTDVEQ